VALAQVVKLEYFAAMQELLCQQFRLQHMMKLVENEYLMEALQVLCAGVELSVYENQVDFVNLLENLHAHPGKKPLNESQFVVNLI
jgi:hypothetical protein